MISTAFDRFMQVLQRDGAAPAGSMSELVLQSMPIQSDSDAFEVLTAGLATTHGEASLRGHLHSLAESHAEESVERPRF